MLASDISLDGGSDRHKSSPVTKKI